MPMNFTKTAVLLAMLTAILVAMGALVGGQQGMVIAFMAALVMNMISFWSSDTIVLKMHGAEEVDQTRHLNSTILSPSWRSVPSCRCRGSTSSRAPARRLRHRSQPVAFGRLRLEPGISRR